VAHPGLPRHRRLPAAEAALEERRRGTAPRAGLPRAPLSPSSDPTDGGAVAFVACIESGPLEALTTTLVDSLRRFGGALSRRTGYAVAPRAGAPLRRQTRRTLESWGCRLLSLRASRPYAWYHFLNKVHAVSAVEELATAETVAFLDSDVLVLQEPT